MDKFVFADVKRLRKNYLLRLFAVSVPFIQIAVVLLIIYSIDFAATDKNLILRLIIYDISVLSAILICGTVFTIHSLKCHKRNTFIDYSKKYAVISLHNRTVIDRHKFRYYKSLYVIKLSDLESISISGGKIRIKGKINYYFGPNETLMYSVNADGLHFGEWWYDYNPIKELESVKIKNYFKGSPKALFIIRQLAQFEQDRKQKHDEYHKAMLEIANIARMKKYFGYYSEKKRS